jgi:hypothetical protein
MKKIIFILAILTTGLLSLPVFSQTEYDPVALGLPGDNLNLYAVLDVFQKSRTLEDFEKAINDRETNINNLDLNNDNRIDYISVVSFREGNSHSIVLRVAINSNEYQDVAVIEVYKNNAGTISIQIIGDEELYGRNYIIEPSDLETLNPGYAGDRTVIINRNRGFYINDWPIMVYLFSPSFSIYVSPWRWGIYPFYWDPWTPVNYYNYWSFHNHYYRNNFYRRSVYVRNPDHYSYYARRRNSSPYVIQNRRSGNYNRTYEGRDFRRPDAPFGGIRTPSTRQTMPSTRQRTSPTRQAFPSARQTAPPQRQTIPSARLGEPSRRQTMPSTRQAVPATRQTVPSQGQAFPSTRQGAPSAWHTAPSQRQGTSPTRQAFPSARQTAPQRR